MNERSYKYSDDDKGLTAEKLKGKQSVRATFRLPASVIELLSIVASQLGIKQKSLFDQLIENRRVLDTVANSVQNYQLSKRKKLQKTYVLSRNSLFILDEIAREYNVSRDVLVEMSINRLRPIIGAEHEKHKKRKALLDDMEPLLHQLRQAACKSAELLERNDPFAIVLASLTEKFEKRYNELGEIVNKGEYAGRYAAPED